MMRVVSCGPWRHALLSMKHVYVTSGIAVSRDQ